MSKEINNREYRQKIIKDLISQLHAGKSAEEVTAQFKEAFEGVSGAEISAAEQALINEGMPVSEIQKLCDIHAAAFKEVIHNEPTPKNEAEIPGHPIHTLIAENKAIKALIEEKIRPHIEKEDSKSLIEDFKLLSQINNHYSRKENFMFPYLEKYGVSGPPKVMWGVDDEIRVLIKEAIAMLQKGDVSFDEIKEKALSAINQIDEMIFKEENILIPMLTETFSQDEWNTIANESDEIGYCLIDAPPEYKPSGNMAEALKKPTEPLAKGIIKLETGVLKIDELICLLNTLPLDITFVDKDDTVKYFSQGLERVFPRTTAVIGRKVANCHPPGSVHIVEGILSDFKSGKKDHEDFWIKMGPKYVYIRYFAVRDKDKNYMGTLEVTQDIAPIKALEGEKRLVSN